MQTEAPRPDKGYGYPGLRMRGDVFGTNDGLAKSLYIRESRRIKAEFTVLEEHVGVDARGGTAGSEPFADTVGIGSYRIDLHPSYCRNYLDINNYPQQIPLGALIPQRVENLLPACKNLGVTHITNGCYRLHPIEWNIGEAAGALAAYCLENGLAPRQVRNDAARLSDFQSMLVNTLGFVLHWREDLRIRSRVKQTARHLGASTDADKDSKRCPLIEGTPALRLSVRLRIRADLDCAFQIVVEVNGRIDGGVEVLHAHILVRRMNVFARPQPKAGQRNAQFLLEHARNRNRAAGAFHQRALAGRRHQRLLHRFDPAPSNSPRKGEPSARIFTSMAAVSLAKLCTYFVNISAIALGS